MKKCHVKLFWPAMWEPKMTYPALPALSAYLNQNGIKTSVEDLNLKYISYCISKKHINHCRKLIDLKKSSPLKNDKKNAIAAELLLDHYEKRISWAQKNISNAFGDKEMINAISQIINCIYYPSEVFLLHGTCGPPFHHVRELEKSVENKSDENPFLVFIEQFVKAIPKTRERDLFGISLSGPFQMLFTYALAKELKRHFPHNKIIVGGAYLPNMTEAIRDRRDRKVLFKYVDAYVIGSGERPLLEYIRQVDSSSKFSPIPGTIVKSNNCYIYSKECSEPFPAAQITVPDMKYLGTTPIPLSDMSYAVEITRGCYWAKCVFCGNRRGVNSKYQPIRIENILSSIRNLINDHGAREIVFSTLAAPPVLLERISRALINAGIKVKWRTWSRLENGLTNERLRLFKKAGCEQLIAAPENFNDSILERMQKGTTGVLNKKILFRLLDHGLLETVNIIYGFPGDTIRNILSEIEFIRRNMIYGIFYAFHVSKTSYVAEYPELFDIRLLRTGRLSWNSNFKFSGKDHLATAVKAIKIAKQRYPLNIDFTFSGQTSAVQVGFRTSNPKIHRTERTFPVLPSFVDLFHSKGRFWAFNALKTRIYELNKTAFLFLDMCDGKKTTSEIGNSLGLGNGVADAFVTKLLNSNVIDFS